MRIKNYIPTYVYPSIYDIDYKSLKQMGKKLCVFDVDNTLVPYEVKQMTPALMSFLDTLKADGWDLMILSNNTAHRVSHFLNGYPMAFISRSLKPLTVGMRRLLKQLPYSKDEIIMIGDQMKTDISCAHKMGIDSILVKSLNRNGEHWYTKILRANENKIIKGIQEIDKSKGDAMNELYR